MGRKYTAQNIYRYNFQEESVFQAATIMTRLSRNQLKTYLCSEVKNLRKRKALPRGNDCDDDGEQRGDGCSSSYSKAYRAPCSPKVIFSSFKLLILCLLFL